MNKIYAVDLRPGNIIRGLTNKHDKKDVWIVTEQEHVVRGRGGACMQVIFKHFFNENKKDMKLNTDHKYDLCSASVSEYALSYDNGDELVCFNDQSEEILFSKRLLCNKSKDLILDADIEDTIIAVYTLDDEIIKVGLPKKAKVVVRETEMYNKGSTADSSTKPAILSNGSRILVPVFINEGEVIVIDTEDYKYVKRACE